METKKDQSFGIVPVYKSPAGFLYCVVQHRAGHWGFPKGHAEESEDAEAAATRELKEEVGIDSVSLIPGVQFSENYTYEYEGVIYDKEVTYFLGLVTGMSVESTSGFESEIASIEWLPFEDARARLSYENNRPTIDQADLILKGL